MRFCIVSPQVIHLKEAFKKGDKTSFHVFTGPITNQSKKRKKSEKLAERIADFILLCQR